jgi:hypothetical protein
LDQEKKKIFIPVPTLFSKIVKTLNRHKTGSSDFVSTKNKHPFFTALSKSSNEAQKSTLWNITTNRFEIKLSLIAEGADTTNENYLKLSLRSSNLNLNSKSPMS